MSSAGFFNAVKHRRTVYGLNDTPPTNDPDQIIQGLIAEAMSTLPSAFNSQPNRLLVVTGAAHKKFWDVVVKTLEPIITGTKGAEAWDRQKGRFLGFRAAYGTIAFFEDSTVTLELQGKNPDFAGAFPQFAEHSTAMHQIVLWTALELEGYGANLQHIGVVPPVEAAWQKEFKLPTEWKAKAQLVFGGLAQEMPPVPEKLPLSETVKYVD